MHRYLNTTQHSVIWFKRAFDSGELEIKPPFQRNPVWSLRQQSALIDTILLEYPIPEIYMQELTDADGIQKQLLVDGQQRIRSVLSYVAGDFDLEDESPNWAGLGFEDLSPEDRKKIYEYAFVIRLLPDMPDEEVRAIFQRINRNTSVLNAQELRHATYWGPFIKLMEEISDFEFWSESGIFSANDRRRMLDVEFISELAVAFLNGLQNKKRLLEEFYQQYETNFEDGERLRSMFQRVLGEIEQVLKNIRTTRWRKKSDFYTLFLLFAEHSDKLPLSSEKRLQASRILENFGSDVDQILADDYPTRHSGGDPAVDYARSVERAASDLGSRKIRQAALEHVALSIFTSPADVFSSAPTTLGELQEGSS